MAFLETSPLTAETRATGLSTTESRKAMVAMTIAPTAEKIEPLLKRKVIKSEKGTTLNDIGCLNLFSL
jgi:hypothetical protein